MTSLAPILPTKQVFSECRLRLYSSSFDFVKKCISCEELCEEWGSDEQWEWLAINVYENDNIDSIAGRLLNFTDYDDEQVFAFGANLILTNVGWHGCGARCDVNLIHTYIMY